MLEEPAEAQPREWPVAWPLLLFFAFAALVLVVLRGALHGPFVSDDIGYIVNNPYAALSMENLAAIFDPGSEARLYAVGNYSPVHLLLHAAERDLFGLQVLGYHLVNVLVHALASVLLVALLRQSGVPGWGALAGGTLFALHPANVEAVAWISQLKSSAGLAFALGALIAFRRHPGGATPLFVLGLLTKAAAAFALPMAVAFTWVRAATPAGSRRHWSWLGLWLLLFSAYGWLEFSEFARASWYAGAGYDDFGVQLRSIAAGGTRYLLMASTSWGVSAFHEPEPVRSLVDPWWLAALPLAALLGWRCVTTLARRREEGAWWVAAAASFLPVSQLFPFVIPLADRYLYFILPGLIGGTLLLGVSLRPRLPAATPRVAAALAAGLIVAFAWHSQARARLWSHELRLLLDAAAHYPQGGTAHFLAARGAAARGDVDVAVTELRLAGERGMARFMLLDEDPGLAPIRAEPAFRELVREWAALEIERARHTDAATQPQLRMLALAHVKRGELAEAEASYQRAVAVGGRLDAVVRLELDAVRARRIAEESHRTPTP